MLEEYSVNYQKLLTDIQRNAVDSFITYLINIKQIVEIKPTSAASNFFSNWKTVTYGVPLGSISGPLTFHNLHE